MQAVNDLFHTLESNALQLQALGNRAVSVPKEVGIVDRYKRFCKVWLDLEGSVRLHANAGHRR